MTERVIGTEYIHSRAANQNAELGLNETQRRRACFANSTGCRQPVQSQVAVDRRWSWCRPGTLTAIPRESQYRISRPKGPQGRGRIVHLPSYRIGWVRLRIIERGCRLTLGGGMHGQHAEPENSHRALMKIVQSWMLGWELGVLCSKSVLGMFRSHGWVLHPCCGDLPPTSGEVRTTGNL
jgi:hypothetical protein